MLPLVARHVSVIEVYELSLPSFVKEIVYVCEASQLRIVLKKIERGKW